MKQELLWGNLLHLSTNMWGDCVINDADFGVENSPEIVAQPYLRCEENLWDELLPSMHSNGLNLLLIDVGDGVQYESHPEISVQNAWTRERVQCELKRLRALGIEPIPKLNFSTAHDAWLGEYSRMVSTTRYYEVCRDVIAEVAQMFETPRFFHLGMDEETHINQGHCEYSLVRNGDLWWHDLYFYVEAVEKAGSRAWMWSDYYWHHPQKFLRKMPQSVLQSNWYYGDKFLFRNDGDEKISSVRDPMTPDSVCVQAYHDLQEHGYDQIPTGSNCFFPDNFPAMIDFWKTQMSDDNLLGFLMTPWKMTSSAWRKNHFSALRKVEDARTAWYLNGSYA